MIIYAWQNLFRNADSPSSDSCGFADHTLATARYYRIAGIHILQPVSLDAMDGFAPL